MYFMILGLLKLFCLQIILSRMTSFFKFFSRCQYFISNLHINFSGNSKNTHVAKKIPAGFDSFKKQTNSMAGKIDDDEGRPLCKEEVELVMETLGVFCHPAAGGDNDHDDILQERFCSEEFSNMFEEKAPCLEEVKGAFDVFDENRDGFIDAEELHRVLRLLGLTEERSSKIEDCRKMIRVFDENADGRIDFHEFVKFMESSFC